MAELEIVLHVGAGAELSDGSEHGSWRVDVSLEVCKVRGVWAIVWSSCDVGAEV